MELGAEMAGIKTLWNCEIEKFQGEILKKINFHMQKDSQILQKQPGFEQVLCDLSKIGYDAEWQCISNYAFGYPHKNDDGFPDWSHRVGSIGNMDEFKFNG